MFKPTLYISLTLLGCMFAGKNAGAHGAPCDCPCPETAPSATLHESPTPTHSIPYLSGGIGEGEQEKMHRAKDDYNVYLLFAEQRTGAYLANVQVRVKNTAGETLFSQVSEGPFFYLMLPEGRYTIIASYKGADKQHAVQVRKGKKLDRIPFAWKGDMDE